MLCPARQRDCAVIWAQWFYFLPPSQGSHLGQRTAKELHAAPPPPPWLSANTVRPSVPLSGHPPPSLIKGLPLESVGAGPAKSGFVLPSVPLFQDSWFQQSWLKDGNTPTGEIT